MDNASAARVADTKAEDRPDHFEGLPEETHIVSGTIVGNGSTELASEKAHLSAKVIKLERTPAGGIDYQLAIVVSEPAPPKAAEPSKPQEDPKFLAAVDYFMSKGQSETDARKKVNLFGVDRVLKAREAELDSDLKKALEPDASSPG